MNYVKPVVPSFDTRKWYRLCLREPVELQKSHFIPAGAYKAIQKSMEQPPVVIKRTVTIKKDEQVTGHVLCGEGPRNCEFNHQNPTAKAHESGAGFPVLITIRVGTGVRRRQVAVQHLH